MRPAWVDRELAFARVLGEELRARAWCYKPGTLGRHVGIEAAWRMAVQRDKEANACSPNAVTPTTTITGEPGDVRPPPALARNLIGGPNVAERTCSIDGCERHAYARGWCRGHYGRWLRTGDPAGLQKRGRPSPSDPGPLFWAKVDKSGGPEACWPWTASLLGGGYGQFSHGGHPLPAHRMAWFLTHGAWPSGEIDHTCHDPLVCKRGDSCPHRLCQNPAHLEDVSSQTNSLRSGSPFALNAAKTHCLRGHPFSGDNLTFDRGRRVCVACLQIRADRRREKAAR